MYRQTYFSNIPDETLTLLLLIREHKEMHWKLKKLSLSHHPLLGSEVVFCYFRYPFCKGLLWKSSLSKFLAIFDVLLFLLKYYVTNKNSGVFPNSKLGLQNIITCFILV